MKNMPQKNLIIVGIVVLLLVVVGAFVIVGKSKQSASKTNGSGSTELSNSTDVLPTVDSSVKVDLAYTDASKEYVELKVDNIPNGTKTLEYELGYNTEKQGQQGVLPSEPAQLNGAKTFTKKMQLATCSSGVCIVHTVVGPIHVSLKFNGDYGARVFEKDYNL